MVTSQSCSDVGMMMMSSCWMKFDILPQRFNHVEKIVVCHGVFLVMRNKERKTDCVFLQYCHLMQIFGDVRSRIIYQEFLKKEVVVLNFCAWAIIVKIVELGGL